MHLWHFFEVVSAYNLTHVFKQLGKVHFIIYLKNLGFNITYLKAVYLKEYSQIRIPLKLMQLMPSITLSPSALRIRANKASYGVNSLIWVKRAECVQEGMFAHPIM